MRLSVTDPAADAAVNVTGTINVLQAALDLGARVVFASTGGAIYGEDAVRPTPESAACEPEAPYGTAKLCAEEYVRLFNRLHGTRARDPAPRQRVRAAAGPERRGGRGRRSSRGASSAASRPTVFGDGLQTRDYVYVGDVVRGVRGRRRRRPRRAVERRHRPRGERDRSDRRAGRRSAAPAIEPDVRAARQGELQASSLDPSAAAARRSACRGGDADRGRPAGRLRVGACGRADSRHAVGVRAAVIPLLAVALAISLLAGHGGVDARSAAIASDRRRGGVRARVVSPGAAAASRSRTPRRWSRPRH